MTKKITTTLTGLGALATATVLYDQNTRVEVETIPIKIKNLPEQLKGFRIIHLSDLHLPCCVLSVKQLANLVKHHNPHIILMTGDIVNRHTNYDEHSLSILYNEMANIAPTFLSIGNHDRFCGYYERWKAIARSSNVVLLDDQWAKINVNGHSMSICGLTYGEPLVNAPKSSTNINIAMSHFPHKLQIQAAAGLDVVFSGHAHGGQVRIKKQGLYAPGQGILPKYTSGLYQIDNTKMIVSRGLSRMMPIIRVNSSPHMPIAILY